MPAEPLHVALELDRDSEPIRGTLRAASRAMEFSGWLALIAELDGLRRGDGHEEDRTQ